MLGRDCVNWLRSVLSLPLFSSPRPSLRFLLFGWGGLFLLGADVAGDKATMQRWVGMLCQHPLRFVPRLRCGFLFLQPVISVGLAVNYIPAVGVIYDPIADEMFTARVGGPATLNRKPIEVAKTGASADSGLPRVDRSGVRGMEACSVLCTTRVVPVHFPPTLSLLEIEISLLAFPQVLMHVLTRPTSAPLPPPLPRAAALSGEIAFALL